LMLCCGVFSAIIVIKLTIYWVSNCSKISHFMIYQCVKNRAHKFDL
jgi:hypothetical protein